MSLFIYLFIYFTPVFAYIIKFAIHRLCILFLQNIYVTTNGDTIKVKGTRKCILYRGGSRIQVRGGGRTLKNCAERRKARKFLGYFV